MQVDQRYPGLWLGSKHAAFNADKLRELGITHILNVSNQPCVHSSSFTYLHLPMKDKAPQSLLGAIPVTKLFITTALKAGSVLVHCRAGRSRSASIAIAFIMGATREPYSDVLRSVRSARGVVAPNEGFERQLLAFERAGFDVYRAQQLLLRATVRRHAGSSWSSCGTKASRARAPKARGARGSAALEPPSPARKRQASSPRLRSEQRSKRSCSREGVSRGQQHHFVPPLVQLLRPEYEPLVLSPPRAMHREVRCRACEALLFYTGSVVTHEPAPSGRPRGGSLSSHVDADVSMGSAGARATTPESHNAPTHDVVMSRSGASDEGVASGAEPATHTCSSASPLVPVAMRGHLGAGHEYVKELRSERDLLASHRHFHSDMTSLAVGRDSPARQAADMAAADKRAADATGACSHMFVMYQPWMARVAARSTPTAICCPNPACATVIGQSQPRSLSCPSCDWRGDGACACIRTTAVVVNDLVGREHGASL